jgi:hypothetical protein
VSDEWSTDRIAKLEERITEAERGIRSLRRRVRNAKLMALAAILFTLYTNRTTLAVRYTALLESLSSRMEVIEAKTDSIRTFDDPVTQVPTVLFTGVNVQIVNGTAESGRDTGSGNLILGYDEIRRQTKRGVGESHALTISGKDWYYHIKDVHPDKTLRRASCKVIYSKTIVP